MQLVALTTARHVRSRLLGVGLKALSDLPDIVESVAAMATGRRLNVGDLAFPMKFAKVGMIDTEQLGRLTARQTAHHLLRIGWKVRCTLCMQVRSQEFGVVTNGDVQVFVYLGHAPLDPWARFLCDRALFFETIA
ncbi:hypothetical protein SDC9_70998 [bioreactor metagenome]|uniref:Uncharacterized protein n=1 Tax=bioreactor metagenome TaxID=1076179 RepID=A0A644Y7I8_9ZZZZ